MYKEKKGGVSRPHRKAVSEAQVSPTPPIHNREIQNSVVVFISHDPSLILTPLHPTHHQKRKLKWDGIQHFPSNTSKIPTHPPNSSPRGLGSKTPISLGYLSISICISNSSVLGLLLTARISARLCAERLLWGEELRL